MASRTNRTEPSIITAFTPPGWALRADRNWSESVVVHGARAIHWQYGVLSGTPVFGGYRVLNSVPPWRALWYRPRVSWPVRSRDSRTSLPISVFDVPSTIDAIVVRDRG